MLLSVFLEKLLRRDIKGSLSLFLKFLWSLLLSSERSEYDNCLSLKFGQKKGGRATQVTELRFLLSIVQVCPKLKDFFFFAFYFPVELKIFYLNVLNISTTIRIKRTLHFFMIVDILKAKIK